MRKILKIASCLLIMSFFSCDSERNTNSVNFKITNNSKQNVELVYLSTIFKEGKTADTKIDINSSIDIEFSFKDVTKSDGAYLFHYKYESTSDTITKEFGYYTNGFPLDDEFQITIYNDSLEISSILIY